MCKYLYIDSNILSDEYIELHRRNRVSLCSTRGIVKHEIVQLPNPKTRRWVKLDKTSGRILSHKKTDGAYKGITIVDTVKCDCGHTKKAHYLGEGSCGECGCTWFHPELKYCKPLRDKR